MAEKITAEVQIHQGVGFVVINRGLVGSSMSGGMPPDVAAEVAARINHAEALAEALERAIPYIEDHSRDWAEDVLAAYRAREA